MHNRLPLILSLILAVIAFSVAYVHPDAYLIAIAPMAASTFFLGVHFIVNMKIEPFYKLPEDHDDGN